MSQRTLMQPTPWLRAVAVVLTLSLALVAVPACGGGAAAGAIVGGVAGAAIGSTFDDPYCCDGGYHDDPYYYATDPVDHDDTW